MVRVFSLGQVQGRIRESFFRSLGNLYAEEIEGEREPATPTASDLEAIAEEEERLLISQPITLSGGRRRKVVRA